MSNINEIKRRYPPGTKIVLLFMDDKQAPPPGTKGVVRYVDDIGTIQISWENGSSLGLIEGVDRFRVEE